MTCLAAVKVGSTDCSQGWSAELATIKEFGIPSESVFPFDGAGSDDQGRTTAAAMATFLRRAKTTSYGKTLYDGLPVLGRNGTLANVLPTLRWPGMRRSRRGTAPLAHPQTSKCCSATAWRDTSRPSAGVV